MTRSKPGSSGVRSDHSASCATTTAHIVSLFVLARKVPFRITFKTDADELSGTGDETMSGTNELAKDPRGTIGFSLKYVQQTC